MSKLNFIVDKSYTCGWKSLHNFKEKLRKKIDSIKNIAQVLKKNKQILAKRTNHGKLYAQIIKIQIYLN